jgi:predicted DNA-binding transcriptional regulator YafY
MPKQRDEVFTRPPMERMMRIHRIIENKEYPNSKQLTELPRGRLRVKLTPSSLEEVGQWILSSGTHATVIEPKELRERIGKIGREFRERYVT